RGEETVPRSESVESLSHLLRCASRTIHQFELEGRGGLPSGPGSGGPRGVVSRIDGPDPAEGRREHLQNLKSLGDELGAQTGYPSNVPSGMRQFPDKALSQGVAY